MSAQAFVEHPANAEGSDMSHFHRFVSPLPGEEADSLMLPPEEAHHALRVLRLRAGEKVSVFDGQGGEIEGSLNPLGKREAEVLIEKRIHHTAPAVKVTIAVAWLHRDKALEDIVRRAVEMAVSRIVFWKGDHSQKKCAAPERWEKIALEACKQSGRMFLPRIELQESLDTFLDSNTAPLILALPDADPEQKAEISVHDQVTLLIGPEGDFSTREVALALERGAFPVHLGDCIFRSEVAASVVMTLLAAQLGVLGRHFSLRLINSDSGG
jgi:16S rRNA (uracil1498-N3)-methyltransferase